MDDTEVTVETNFEDEFKRLPAVTSSSKVKAFDCLLEQSGKAKVATTEIVFLAFEKCIASVHFKHLLFLIFLRDVHFRLCVF